MREKKFTYVERCLMCGRFYGEVLPDRGCCSLSCGYDFARLKKTEQAYLRRVGHMKRPTGEHEEGR
jgi:hypothetical protein